MKALGEVSEREKELQTVREEYKTEVEREREERRKEVEAEREAARERETDAAKRAEEERAKMEEERKEGERGAEEEKRRLEEERKEVERRLGEREEELGGVRQSEQEWKAKAEQREQEAQELSLKLERSSVEVASALLFCVGVFLRWLCLRAVRAVSGRVRVLLQACSGLTALWGWCAEQVARLEVAIACLKEEKIAVDSDRCVLLFSSSVLDVCCALCARRD